MTASPISKVEHEAAMALEKEFPEIANKQIQHKSGANVRIDSENGMVSIPVNVHRPKAFEKLPQENVRIASSNSEVESSKQIKEQNQAVQIEADKNRSSYKAARLQMIETRRSRITQLESQIEQLVASHNVQLANIENNFSRVREDLREQTRRLMEQLELVNKHLDNEQKEYQHKVAVLEERYQDSLSDAQVLLASERASLEVLQAGPVAHSPYAEAAVEQVAKKSEVFLSEMDKAGKAEKVKMSEAAYAV